MLFKPEKCQAMLERRATQTRRLVQEDEFAVNQHGRLIPDNVWGDRIDTVYSASGRIKWQVGRTYAIQPGRGKKAIGRTPRLIGIRREYLQDISEEDARQEAPPEYNGVFETWRDCLRVLWNEIHTKPSTRFEDNPEVWVLEFEKAT